MVKYEDDMTVYQRQFGARRHTPRRLLMLLAVIAVLVVGGSIIVHDRYNHNLQPVSSSTQEVHVTILPGTSSSAIAQQLLGVHLIRSTQAFEFYVQAHNIRDKLQAGTYSFSESMGTDEIAEAIAAGKVATDLLTILPGQRLDQIKNTFSDADFKTAAIASAFRASQYRTGYPALADNPANASLEGFLFPDSYQLTADTDPSEIISESLKEMQKHLTTDVRAGFAKHGLTVYQGVTLASIVEQEVPSAADRAKVAQVFLLRLKRDMTLGSDVTVIYARAVHNDNYSTVSNKGLPPGPIGTVSDSALQAVAHPASTDWLFFVSGDNDKTYFSHTYEEHKANIAKYCHQKCPGN
jgi:UPF0755 protein